MTEDGSARHSLIGRLGSFRYISLYFFFYFSYNLGFIYIGQSYLVG
jgi:hypothetical protein